MEKLEPLCTVDRIVKWCSHYGKQCGDTSKKVKNKITILFSHLISGYISKKIENRISKRYLHTHLHTILFKIAKIWKQPKCPPTDEPIFKNVTYTYNEIYYLALKKTENLSYTAIGMNLEDIVLSELSQSQKDKYYVIPLI